MGVNTSRVQDLGNAGTLRGVEFMNGEKDGEGTLRGVEFMNGEKDGEGKK